MTLETPAERDDSIVSFDDEPLILVDGDDRELGYLPKAEAHRGAGRLHRAFSLFVFNQAGELLLQQRAAAKRLWPYYWSNSCCSHPRRGEPLDVAVERRLEQELGLRCDLHYLFKFQYQAQYDADGAEHEVCSVFVGRSHDRPRINANEIKAIRYIGVDALDAELAATPERFTPWFRIEWMRLRSEFPQLPASLAAAI